MRKLWNRRRVLTLAALALIAPCVRGDAPQFRRDLQFFARELPKRHKNAFHYSTAEQFRAAVAELDARLDSLDEDGFYAGLVRIAAMIGDAHTRAYAPESAVALFPIVVTPFDGIYRVTQIGPGLEKALGARLVKIDDTPSERFYTTLSPLAAQNENATYAPAWVNAFLHDARILLGAGITHKRETARYTFEDDSGAPFSLDLTAIGAEQFRGLAWVPLVKQSYFAQISEPMRNSTPTFSYTYVASARTVYANVRSMREVSKPGRELLDFVRQKQADKLIIDLRQNPGGDYFHGLHGLIEPIKKMADINRKGHLFVLIGPMTGSAAIINATQFHTMTQAILVGQPIGAKPTEYSELRTMKLPGTGFVVGYSVRYYDFSFNKENVVVPDQEIRVSWEELKSGKNPVLEWCFAYRNE
jgi:hypothetical protein